MRSKSDGQQQSPTSIIVETAAQRESVRPMTCLLEVFRTQSIRRQRRQLQLCASTIDGNDGPGSSLGGARRLHGAARSRILQIDDLDSGHGPPMRRSFERTCKTTLGECRLPR
jgi:hypothetical protein